MAPAARAAIRALDRYIAIGITGKRLLMTWADRSTCPSNLVNVAAFDDDYSMGLLCSSVHERWARAQSSTLEDRLRYTPTTVFATFPWPAPDDVQRVRIGRIAKRLIELRDNLSVDRSIGLTKLYNECDDGAHKDLRALHDELDQAVAEAYGWPAAVLSRPGEVTSRLCSLNAAIAAGEQTYSPFPPLAIPEEPQGERLFVPEGELR